MKGKSKSVEGPTLKTFSIVCTRVFKLCQRRADMLTDVAIDRTDEYNVICDDSGSRLDVVGM
jgi:hypothetical protein